MLRPIRGVNFCDHRMSFAERRLTRTARTGTETKIHSVPGIAGIGSYKCRTRLQEASKYKFCRFSAHLETCPFTVRAASWLFNAREYRYQRPTGTFGVCTR